MSIEENADSFVMKRMGRPLKVFRISVADLTSKENRKIYERIKNIHIRKVVTRQLSPEEIKKKFRKLKPEQLNHFVLSSISIEQKDVGKTVKQICESGEEYVNIPLSDIKRHFNDPMYEVLDYCTRK